MEMGWLLSTSLVSGNTAVLERRRTDTRLCQRNHKIMPSPLSLPPSHSLSLLLVFVPVPFPLSTRAPSSSTPAQLGVQRHHVQELALSIAPQLTSDTHHAHSTDHTHGRHAPGAISTGRSKRPQYGSHAQTPLGQILHASVVR